MSIDAMTQALEALEHEAQKGNDDAYRVERDALRAAIEQAQEPVAWMTHTESMMPLFHMSRRSALNWETQPTPLYTAPPRQWQGLTDDEAVDLLPYGDWEIESTLKFARAIEAKLKEKNNA